MITDYQVITDLPPRLQNVFRWYGINDIQLLAQIHVSDLKKLPNLGNKSLQQIDWLLCFNGLVLNRQYATPDHILSLLNQ
jgi:DNA-directed RNA polymerase alpha subunit